MSEIEQARIFLNMAAKDLDALERMVRHGGFAEEVFGLHAQQATEKALKAWLCLLNADCPRTHDLDYLIGAIKQCDEEVAEEIQELTDLTDFGALYRYEPYPDMDESLDRVRTVRQVGALIEHVSRRLNEADMPNE